MRKDRSVRRFSLRFLLICVTALAVGLAAWTNASKQLRGIADDYERLETFIQAPHPEVAKSGVAANGHSCIAAIPRSGGNAMVTYEPLPQWLNWFASISGNDGFPQITEVQIVASGFNDEQLEMLGKVQTLKSIDFNLSQVTDQGLARFCEVSQVKRIVIGEINPGISESGRLMARKKTQGQDYTTKWPPSD